MKTRVDAGRARTSRRAKNMRSIRCSSTADEFRRPDGALERASPEEGDLRLARVRGRAVRDQHRLADEEDRLRDVRPGRVGAGGRDPVRRLQAAGGRRGPDPERFADAQTIPRSRRRCWRDRGRLEARRGRKGQVALRRREQRPDLRTTSTRRSSRLEIRGPSEEAADKVDPIVAASPRCRRQTPRSTSARSARAPNKELQASFKDDLKRAGLFSVPLTLIILLVAFGALVAAGIPLLLGLTAVLGTLGLVAVISQVLPMSDSVSAIILLIGLAVGVDYTMFYLKREREERAAGRSEEAALEAAAATSGRSVLISGLDRARCHGGHVPHRRRRLCIVRRRDDDGGRGRDARVADRAAGAALQARRQGRPRPRAVRPPVPPRRRRGADLGSDHRPRAPAAGPLGRARRRAAGRPRGARATSCTRPQPSIDTLSAEVPRRPTTASRRRSPARRSRPNVVVKASERRRAGGPGGDRPAETARARNRRHERADRRRRRTLRRRSRASSIPIEGDGTDSTSNAALAALRDDIVPATVGALPAPRSPSPG